MDESRDIMDDLSDIQTKELRDALPNYFEFDGDVDGTAYLNWRFDFNRDVEAQFFNMAKGYFETSIALLDNCIADNRGKKADIWIFPIMFNVVHGIEIYLKGFNSIYRILKKLQNGEYQDSKIEGKHDIRQLCQVSMKLLSNSGNGDLLEEMKFVRKFIEYLYQHTNDMTFARYPITKKGEQHFYVTKKDNVTINLAVFRQWILRLYHVLDSCTGYVDFQVDELKSWQAEMQRYYSEN